MGMLSTKDHQGIFESLLRPQDQLHLVPVPDHSTSDPQHLSQIAKNVNINLTKINTYQDLFVALQQIIFTINDHREVVVICGSLYLIGYFLSNFDNV